MPSTRPWEQRFPARYATLHRNAARAYQQRHLKVGLCHFCPKPVCVKGIFYEERLVETKPLGVCFTHLQRQRNAHTAARQRLTREGRMGRRGEITIGWAIFLAISSVGWIAWRDVTTGWSKDRSRAGANHATLAPFVTE